MSWSGLCASEIPFTRPQHNNCMPPTNTTVSNLFVPLVQVYLYSIVVQRLKLYNTLCILPFACFKTCLNELFSSTSVLVDLEQLRIGKFLEQWECRLELLALSPPLWGRDGGWCSCYGCTCTRLSYIPSVHRHQILVASITCYTELLLCLKYSAAKMVSLQGFASIYL